MDLLKRQGFYNSIILYAGTALGFFNLIILFQRTLTLEEIGFFSIMNTVTLLYAQIASVGISNIIFKYFPHYRSDDKKHAGFVTFVIVWCSINFILFTLVFLWFQNDIIAYYQEKKASGSGLLVQYFYLLIPLAFLTMVYTVIESMAITVFKNVLSSFLREVVLRVFTAIGVLLIAFSVIKYRDFLTIYIAASAFIILVLWYYLYRAKDFKLTSISPLVLKRKKEFVKYGIFTLLSGTSAVLIQSLDNLILSYIKKDLNVVGIYSTFFAIAMVISLPAKALSRTSLQIIAQAFTVNDLPKIGRIYHKTSVMQMLIGCLFFVGLISNKQFILILLHKPEYSSYFDVFIVVGLGFLIDITGGINGYIINLSHYYKMGTYFIIGGVAVCAATNWLLIPVMGMMGAAIAYFLTLFVLNFSYWLYIKIKFGLQPFGKPHILIVLIAGVALLIGLYLPIVGNVWVDMLVRSGIIVLIYVPLLYVLKVSEDINELVDKALNKVRNSK